MSEQRQGPGRYPGAAATRRDLRDGARRAAEALHPAAEPELTEPARTAFRAIAAHLADRRQPGKGTTIDHFQLNEVVSQIAFGGRRGRVYRQIVSLSGVRPGDSVLDVGSSSGYLARKLAAAAGRPVTSRAWIHPRRPSPTRGGAHSPP